MVDKLGSIRIHGQEVKGQIVYKAAVEEHQVALNMQERAQNSQEDASYSRFAK
ncbi:hypothetical protein [Pontibacter pamirensis]|uniref:hypothetical protein n=1 Tax=Pontibacter pamirensis TaxID=2562824 RepID=UPI00138A1E38|nr:hypothetical protein [Pontibacter pamirensis]